MNSVRCSHYKSCEAFLEKYCITNNDHIDLFGDSFISCHMEHKKYGKLAETFNSGFNPTEILNNVFNIKDS